MRPWSKLLIGAKPKSVTRRHHPHLLAFLSFLFFFDSIHWGLSVFRCLFFPQKEELLLSDTSLLDQFVKNLLKVGFVSIDKESQVYIDDLAD